MRVAIVLADEEGLEAVSMRRLARELQAGAMSLYHYFENRDELLELMIDTVAAEMVVPELPDRWRPAIEAVAQHSREMFRTHTWVLPIFQDVPAVTPNLLRHIEQTARAVSSLGGAVDPALLAGLTSAVDDFTIGFTLRELGSEERRGRNWGTPEMHALLDSGEFPLVSSFIAAGAPMPAPDFAQGLKWLLDGFEAQLA